MIECSRGGHLLSMADPGGGGGGRGGGGGHRGPVPFPCPFCSSNYIFIVTQCSVFNVYCPECPPGGIIGHPGGQQKKFLPFGHGRDLVAFNGTGL